MGLILPAYAANNAPVIAPVSDQYLLEGESFKLHIVAHDIDLDPLALGVTGRPVGAAFTDSGNGAALLQWRPDYTGPNSSEGSPFNITLWASDGLKTTTVTTRIFVINSNRKPVISHPNSVTGMAGKAVSFALSATDPDNDSLSWSVISHPANSQVTIGSQVEFAWSTALKDSGSYEAKFAATDRFGAADTAIVNLDIAPAVIYALSIDTASGYSGDIVPVNLRLSNLVPVAGFDVLINYDVSALTLASLTQTGTRAAGFEYFSYRLNERNITGDIHVTGIADILNGKVTPNLPAGDGPIVAMTYYTAGDLNFAGMAVPVTFAFHDLLNRSDNTMTDTAGNRIEQSAIQYGDGYVAILKVSQDGLGDINLNGLSYEIGDAIYFTNYFIDPRNSPLSSLQRANSDVNQDGLPATVADLVYLINKIVDRAFNNKLRYDGGAVDVAARQEDGQFALYL